MANILNEMLKNNESNTELIVRHSESDKSFKFALTSLIS